MKKSNGRASLRASRTAHTVLLRMAADDARAERIRDLKSAYPDVRWHEIAAYVGVSERSALSWAATGAIAPGNAAKLNEFFRKHGAQIDDDYIWRGERPATPNLMHVMKNGDAQLDRIEAVLTQLLERQEALEAAVTEMAEHLAEALRQAPPTRKRASGT